MVADLHRIAFFTFLQLLVLAAVPSLASRPHEAHAREGGDLETEVFQALSGQDAEALLNEVMGLEDRTATTAAAASSRSSHAKVHRAAHATHQQRQQKASPHQPARSRSAALLETEARPSRSQNASDSGGVQVQIVKVTGLRNTRSGAGHKILHRLSFGKYDATTIPYVKCHIIGHYEPESGFDTDSDDNAAEIDEVENGQISASWNPEHWYALSALAPGEGLEFEVWDKNNDKRPLGKAVLYDRDFLQGQPIPLTLELETKDGIEEAGTLTVVLALEELKSRRAPENSTSEILPTALTTQGSKTTCCCSYDVDTCHGPDKVVQPKIGIRASQTQQMCCSFSTQCQTGSSQTAGVFCERKLKSLMEMIATIDSLEKAKETLGQEKTKLQDKITELHGEVTSRNGHDEELQGEIRGLKDRNAELEARLQAQEQRVKESVKGPPPAPIKLDSTDPLSAGFEELQSKLDSISQDFLVHQEKMDDMKSALETVHAHSQDKLSRTVDYVLAQAKAVHRRNSLEHLHAWAREKSLIANTTEDMNTHVQNMAAFNLAIKQDKLREQKLNDAQFKYQELVPLLPGEEELFMNSSTLARSSETDVESEVVAGVPPVAMQSIISSAMKVHRHHAAEHKTSLAQEERARVDSLSNLELHRKAAMTLKAMIEADAERARKLQEATNKLNEVRELVGNEENENEFASLSTQFDQGNEVREEIDPERLEKPWTAQDVTDPQPLEPEDAGTKKDSLAESIIQEVTQSSSSSSRHHQHHAHGHSHNQQAHKEHGHTK
mmetsp:Transcript_33153/g.77564  ORF Transcript_33153/g.77564 Transcript_33153/m.77564 type:complete len:781 (+) Transcript_33153:124-2466(+)